MGCPYKMRSTDPEYDTDHYKRFGYLVPIVDGVKDTLRRSCLMKMSTFVAKKEYRNTLPLTVSHVVNQAISKMDVWDAEGICAGLKVLNWICFDSEAQRDELSDRTSLHDLAMQMIIDPKRAPYSYLLLSLLSMEHPRRNEVVDITAQYCVAFASIAPRLEPRILVQIFTPMLKNSDYSIDKLQEYIHNEKPMNAVQIYLEYLQQLTEDIIRNRIKPGFDWRNVTGAMMFLYECAGVDSLNAQMRKLDCLQTPKFLPYYTYRMLELYGRKYPEKNNELEKVAMMQLIVMLSENLSNSPTILEIIRVNDPLAAKSAFFQIKWQEFAVILASYGGYFGQEEPTEKKKKERTKTKKRSK